MPRLVVALFIVLAPALGVISALAAEPGGSPVVSPAGSLERVDFVHDVVPALTKAGCNMGACHGSFQGRGGLRLSLLGFDPAADYETLTKDARGRRVFPAAPAQSMLLRKPTLETPHGGGRRLKLDSELYTILHRWIAEGLDPPDPAWHVARIVIEPAELLQAAGQSGSLRVTAHDVDGAVRDVTRFCLFDAREEAVASVTPEGMVTSHGPGRTSVVVRYAGLVATVPVTTPYGPSQPPAGFVARNFFDERLNVEWTRLGLAPAAVCDDATFLRRASLDLAGSLPRPEEVRVFLASQDPEKRSRLVDELLARSEHVDFWAQKWSDLLRAHRRSLGEKGLASFQSWLKGRLRENAPFDQIVRELLTAEGNLYTNGAVAYWFVDKTPEELAETTAHLFLGIRLQCAKCHHHPFEVWSQDDYYGLAGFFTGLARKDTREGGRFGGSQTLKLAPVTAMKHPGTGREAPVSALGYRPTADALKGDARKELAAWITAPENPRFARNIVNRCVGEIFGRGLVHPVDDLSAANPAVMPAVLDALCADFVEHGYDLRRLLRTICTSRAYELSAELDPVRDRDGAFYTHRVLRRLPAEVLLDAINQAAGTKETFADYPSGTRAIALSDPAVDSYFLNAFGRPQRTTTCVCERQERPDLRQILHLANGASIDAKVRAEGGRLAQLLSGPSDDAAVLEELYLATLSRFPDEHERSTALQLIGAAPSRKEGFEDLLWALINMGEFAFNR